MNRKCKLKIEYLEGRIKGLSAQIRSLSTNLEDVKRLARGIKAVEDIEAKISRGELILLSNTEHNYLLDKVYKYDEMIQVSLRRF